MKWCQVQQGWLLFTLTGWCDASVLGESHLAIQSQTIDRVHRGSLSLSLSLYPPPSTLLLCFRLCTEATVRLVSYVCVCINSSPYQAQLINCMLKPKEWHFVRPLLEEKRTIRISLSCSSTY